METTTPIPEPDGNSNPVVSENVTDKRNWKKTPIIVRVYAYFINWLNIIGAPILILITILDESDLIEKLIIIAFASYRRPFDLAKHTA